MYLLQSNRGRQLQGFLNLTWLYHFYTTRYLKSTTFWSKYFTSQWIKQSILEQNKNLAKLTYQRIKKRKVWTAHVVGLRSFIFTIKKLKLQLSKQKSNWLIRNVIYHFLKSPNVFHSPATIWSFFWFDRFDIWIRNQQKITLLKLFLNSIHKEVTTF